MPGDPAAVLAGDLASEERVERIRDELNLDLPWIERYVAYVTQLARGDLGNSFYSRLPIFEEIARRLPSSIELAVLSLSVTLGLGIILGGVGAYFRGRWPDTAANGVMSVTQSIPDFFLALILIYVFFFLLGVAPAPTGRLSLSDVAPDRVTGSIFLDCIIEGNWTSLWSAASRSILPVLTLAIYYSAYIGRPARSAMGKAISSPQVQFARACGLSEYRVLWYAFLEARTPILTYAAILFASMVGGQAIIEVIFSWGGVGEWALNSILRLDIPAIQGFVLVVGASTLATYVALDVIVMLLDPRIRYG